LKQQEAGVEVQRRFQQDGGAQLVRVQAAVDGGQDAAQRVAGDDGAWSRSAPSAAMALAAGGQQAVAVVGLLDPAEPIARQQRERLRRPPRPGRVGMRLLAQRAQPSMIGSAHSQAASSSSRRMKWVRRPRTTSISRRS
jgi:hypothetical protein